MSVREMAPVQGRLVAAKQNTHPHRGYLRDAQYFDDSRQRGTRRDWRRRPRWVARIGKLCGPHRPRHFEVEAFEPTGEREPLHDRGKVLVQMALVLMRGGESCSDIEHLRVQDTLFGSVPSDTSTFHEVSALP